MKNTDCSFDIHGLINRDLVNFWEHFFSFAIYIISFSFKSDEINLLI